MTNESALRGLRRELTRELFEELTALQCAPEEILGYIGTDGKKLRRWCRRTYGRPLEAMMEMIRMDGLIAIRRASFDQLKKSASIISQQYNRFLPNAAAEARAGAEAALRSLTAAVMPPEEELRDLFDEPGEDPA